MVAGKYRRSALGALSAVFVVLRQFAYGKVDHDEVATYLDLAEYLPRLLAEEQDETGRFREVLVDLVTLCPDFRLALDRFDHPEKQW